MDYLLEITRIIDGAMKGDRTKVIAYTKQLARKRCELGDVYAVDRLLKALKPVNVSEIVLQNLRPLERSADNEGDNVITSNPFVKVRVRGTY